MRAGLAAVGYRLSGKRVWRLMKAAGLRGRHPKAWRRTTIGGADPVAAPDLLGRSFFAEQPNQKWCGDVTYIKTWDGWAYLATVIDLHSRKLIGVGDRRPHAHEPGHRRPGHGRSKTAAHQPGLFSTQTVAPKADSSGRRNTSMVEVDDGKEADDDGARGGARWSATSVGCGSGVAAPDAIAGAP